MGLNWFWNCYWFQISSTLCQKHQQNCTGVIQKEKKWPEYCCLGVHAFYNWIGHVIKWPNLYLSDWRIIPGYDNRFSTGLLQCIIEGSCLAHNKIQFTTNHKNNFIPGSVRKQVLQNWYSVGLYYFMKHTAFGFDIQSHQSKFGMIHECSGWYHEVRSKFLQKCIILSIHCLMIADIRKSLQNIRVLIRSTRKIEITDLPPAFGPKSGSIFVTLNWSEPESGRTKKSTTYQIFFFKNIWNATSLTLYWHSGRSLNVEPGKTLLMSEWRSFWVKIHSASGWSSRVASRSTMVLPGLILRMDKCELKSPAF